MNPHAKGKLDPVAAAVGAALLAGASAPALAQQEPVQIEEIVVTGIRGSLTTSMNVKRTSVGVVDAITAEDIGKFPDTNLAESLQRITGVSISRVNGEGSEVTVRGFGGENNMIMLNGRMMPTASMFGGASGAGGSIVDASRSFDFANLASESVRGVEVYKTGRAQFATGGIGAVVNILTTKPLMSPGLHGSFSVKAVNDTTNEAGDDLTPELSGIFSWTDDQEKFGVAVSASYQERDSGAAGAALNHWNIGRWGEDNLYSFAPGAEIVNPPDPGQLYARPNDVRYSFSDRHRERTNGQLTLQYRPTETLTATLDYLYAENYLQEHRGEATFWFANNTSATRVVFDDSVVATPLIYSETLSNKDNGFEQQWREQENTLDSIGFNLDWAATDRLTLSLDVHDSSLESLPVGPGQVGEVAVSVAAPIHTSQTADFSGDIPIVSTTINDAITNGNGQWDLDDFGTQVGRLWYGAQTTDITQVRLDGSWEFADGRIDFGVETRAMETSFQTSNRQMTFGDWGVADPGSIPDGLIEEFSMAAMFDDYDLHETQEFGIRATDPVALMAWAIDTYATPENGYVFQYNPDFGDDSLIEEDTAAVYFQVAMEGELAGLETNLLFGVRYEKTDVFSQSNMRLVQHLLWMDNNDFIEVRESAITPVSEETDYSHVLPSFDFDINLRDDLKARLSYSKTISRARYVDLTASVGNFGTVGSTFLGTTPTAEASNPQLVPLESDNLDLSLEWYYDDASYASVGFFDKRVSNFVGTEQIDETHFGIRDQTNGPRAQAAAEALESLGVSVDDTSLFVMMAVLDNPQDFPNGAADFVANGTVVDADFAVDVATLYDLVPNEDDPLMVFRTATPVNNKQAHIYGAELAIQHFFGDTGFGIQANYTMVEGDIGFDVASDPGTSQFALTGLSDTANLVAIYENEFLQARVAWNWRDDYLARTNEGNSRNPVFVEAYDQLDASVTWLVNDRLAVSVEGLNITGENIRHYNRTPNQLFYLQDLGARYQIGARYTFD
ncbi:MAG TPA: TonB-dependent receptor [Woeseiaceae bacterium]|nr:TonB-dependent receptor [Woeseiaceae bacterium]